jgi:hypothetical protein
MFSVKRYGTPSLRVALLMNPIVPPNIDVFPITNCPVAAPFKDPAGMKDALPRVAHILFRSCFQKLVMREVFSLESLGN